MVIVEIKRDFDGFDRLLGEHKWSEFLSNPSAEEAEKVTRIYHCVFNSGRQVQKNGVFTCCFVVSITELIAWLRVEED